VYLSHFVGHAAAPQCILFMLSDRVLSAQQTPLWSYTLNGYAYGPSQRQRGPMTQVVLRKHPAGLKRQFKRSCRTLILLYTIILRSKSVGLNDQNESLNTVDLDSIEVQPNTQYPRFQTSG